MMESRERERRARFTSWRYCESQKSPRGATFSRRERPSRRVSLELVNGVMTCDEMLYDRIAMLSDGESRVTKSRSPSRTRLRSNGRRGSSSKKKRNWRGKEAAGPAAGGSSESAEGVLVGKERENGGGRGGVAPPRGRPGDKPGQGGREPGAVGRARLDP